MANNDTNDLRLAQVFATKAFRIPDYQRGYAWGVRQWNDLWEDIWDINEDTSTGDYQLVITNLILRGQSALKKSVGTVSQKRRDGLRTKEIVSMQWLTGSRG